MSDTPRVATILLVAVESRQRVLASSLRVVGEPVAYTLDTIEPKRLTAVLSAASCWCDVILIDGESVAEDEEREDLLRAAYMHADRLSTVLYLSTRLPSNEESELSLVWADDVIGPGWQFGDRLRRRVQSIALAPWRRSMALRVEAQRRGDRCLRLIRPREPEPERSTGGWNEPITQTFAVPLDRTLPTPIADRARGFGHRVSDLAADAFYEGWRVASETVEQISQRLVYERACAVEALTPSQVEAIDALYQTVPATLSPVVVARHLGALTALESLCIELRARCRPDAAGCSAHGEEP